MEEFNFVRTLCVRNGVRALARVCVPASLACGHFRAHEMPGQGQSMAVAYFMSELHHVPLIKLVNICKWISGTLGLECRVGESGSFWCAFGFVPPWLEACRYCKHCFHSLNLMRNSLDLLTSLSSHPLPLDFFSLMQAPWRRCASFPGMNSRCLWSAIVTSRTVSLLLLTSSCQHLLHSNYDNRQRCPDNKMLFEKVGRKS